MNFRELEAQVKALLPNASFGHDNDGQVIIYTDLHEDWNGNLWGKPPVYPMTVEMMMEGSPEVDAYLNNLRGLGGAE